MKTLISVILAFLFVYFFTQDVSIEKPHDIDYNKIIYQDNRDIVLEKQLCENLKIEIRLIQFDIRNKIGISGDE